MVVDKQNKTTGEDLKTGEVLIVSHSNRLQASLPAFVYTVFFFRLSAKTLKSATLEQILLKEEEVRRLVRTLCQVLLWLCSLVYISSCIATA